MVLCLEITSPYSITMCNTTILIKTLGRIFHSYFIDSGLPLVCQYYFWISPSLTTRKNCEAEEEISSASTNSQQTESGFRKNNQKNDDTQEEYWQWSIILKHRAEEPSGRRASARQLFKYLTLDLLPRSIYLTHNLKFVVDFPKVRMWWGLCPSRDVMGLGLLKMNLFPMGMSKLSYSPRYVSDLKQKSESSNWIPRYAMQCLNVPMF